MKKILNTGKFLLLLVLTLSFVPMTAFASQISDLENKQSDISEDIKKQQQMMEEANKQIEITKNELVELDISLQEAKNNLLRAEEDVNNATEILKETESELNEVQANYEQQLETFKQRLRVMYEFGEVGYLEVLLGSESIAEFFNRLEYVNAIAKHDKEIVDELVELESNIKAKLFEVQEQKIAVEKLLIKQTSITNDLKSARNTKSSLISTLDSNVERYEESIAELEKSSKEIENMIKKIQEEQAKNNAKVYYTGGEMEWPVPSSYRITSPFGNRTHPITGVKTMHKGIDIGANSGTNVIASEDGIVISSSYINGYGNTVIIDHGDGYSTLYAHNSALKVSLGQEVSRGDVVALIGSTGFSTGPHLHFEVRKNGVATNPMNFLGSGN